MSGRNWGDAVVDKSSLVFRVDKKTAFNIAIPDVSQVRLLCFRVNARQLAGSAHTVFAAHGQVGFWLSNCRPCGR